MNMTDPIPIPNEPQDQTEKAFLIKGYDHIIIPQEANRVFGVAKDWENDWQKYGQAMLIDGIEKVFSERGVDGKDEGMEDLQEMNNRIKELKRVPLIDDKDDAKINEVIEYLDKVDGVETQLNNIKIEKYNELYPEIVEEERKEVLKRWFDPDSDKRDGESYWGRFTIQSVEDSIDLTIPSEETVKKVTTEIQKLFPKGVNVRICIKKPTYQTNTVSNNWNSYSKEERTFPVFISYSSG